MIRVVIIDSIQENILHLSFLIQKIKGFEIVNTFSNPYDALETVISGDFELLFLELNPDSSNYVRHIPENISIVATSVYKEYAIDAFELNMLDYLIIPISESRLQKSIAKLFKKLNISSKSSGVVRGYSFIKVDKKYIKIYHDQILFLESVGDYVKIKCKDDTFITHSTLKQISSLLPNEYFIRVHRSYTISTDRITAIEGNLIEIGNDKIPMGRKYAHEVKNRILNQDK